MNTKKEFYRRVLPHYQQPGQWYFVTISLEGAMPKGAMEKYSQQLESARYRYLLLVRGVGLSKSDNFDLGKSKSPGGELTIAKKDYSLALQRYYLAFDKILNHSHTPGISLNNEKNRLLIEDALKFWENKRLSSHAWCVMPNHLHWVLTIFKYDEKGNPLFLQDILHSVKLFTARRINRNENLSGQLWTHESFETTIRNERHFVRAINYTMNNPVKAGLVVKWKDWPGTYVAETDFLSS